MPPSNLTELNLAVFADYENVAIGVRDAKYDAFDIDLVIERLLDKGKIVVKKAYADWDRYKSAKRPMHEAAFELIEIPHVSYSGKNSADIRLVVDALDLCYTKSHVNTFVIVSGDSDFSPLVSKLRENNKIVIGLGVKNSSSDLLIDNCDEFIYYDDLVRKKGGSKRGRRPVPPVKDSAVPRDGALKEPKLEQPPLAAAGVGAPTKDSKEPKDSAAPSKRAASTADKGDKQEALEYVLDTCESLFQERDDAVWGSMVKQTLKRKRPTFSESYYGYRTFNHLLEEAGKLGLLELQKDEKSGGYMVIAFGPNA